MRTETSPVPSAEAIWMTMNAGAQSGVNPYVLGTMILQEQANGTSGTYRNCCHYEEYYNFFHIEIPDGFPCPPGAWVALPSRKLWTWNSIEKSILGGALYYGENFVSRDRIHFI